MPFDLKDALLAPDRVLVFCDDTEIAGQPVETLNPDLRILVAVQLESDHYASVSAEMSAWLFEAGVTEFHATDIVSGKGQWKNKTITQRQAALRFVADTLTGSMVRVDGIWMPKGSYPAYKKEAEKLGSVGVGFKGGLRRVFLRCLMERLSHETRPVALVLDQDKSQSGIVIETNWPEGGYLVGGGPITAPSHLIIGLQMADAMAWAINRFQIKRTLYDGDEHSEFDQIAMALVAMIPGKLTNVLIEMAA